MPKCGYIEDKIYEIEKFKVTILYNNSDVYSNKQLPTTYDYSRRAPDEWTVSEWIQKRFSTTFPGYDVNVLFATGFIPSGNTRLKTVRASYLVGRA